MPEESNNYNSGTMTSLFDLLTIKKYNQVVFCPYIVFMFKITFAFRS